MARFALPAALRGHELVALGAGAGVLVVGYTMLRNRVPVVAAGAPADGGASFDPNALAALLVGAASNGAAAAVAGFSPGAELGAAGLGVASQAFDSSASLAGYAVTSSAQVAGQLADSQAFIGAAGIGLAQSLGTGLLDLLPSPIYPTLPLPETIRPPDPIATIQPVPVPPAVYVAPAPVYVAPAPVYTAPAPASWAPASMGTPPAGATAALVVTRGTYRVYTVSGGAITGFTDRSTAPIGIWASSWATYPWPAQGSQRILVRLLSSGWAGGYVSPLQAGVTPYRNR